MSVDFAPECRRSTVVYIVFDQKYVFLLIIKLGIWTFSRMNVLFPVKNNSIKHFSTAKKRIIQTVQSLFGRNISWFGFFSLCLGMRNQQVRPRTNPIMFKMISLTMVPEESLRTEQVCSKKAFLTFYFWTLKYLGKNQ